MKKGRLEAFSDGVVAIIITIMVLELHVPHGSDLSDLVPVLPVLMSYILSFVYVGIYWNNHHHMLYAVEKINGSILWANLNLLFWLSLIPFATAWMGEHHFAQWPVILYGAILIMNGLAYNLLCNLLIRQAGKNSPLAEALGKDWKGKLSVVIYALAIALAFLNPWIAFGLYVVVAIIWFIPDRRIEKKIAGSHAPASYDE
ncbi:MAG TPA: TMEM175 family protein [Puia sp.]|nr:TMEM175 family protein [Puia sp.]